MMRDRRIEDNNKTSATVFLILLKVYIRKGSDSADHPTSEWYSDAVQPFNDISPKPSPSHKRTWLKTVCKSIPCSCSKKYMGEFS